MNDLIFEVTQEDDGGYVAECLTEPIFTEGDNWTVLRDNVRDAVAGFFFDTDLLRHPELTVRTESLRAGRVRVSE